MKGNNPGLTQDALEDIKNNLLDEAEERLNENRRYQRQTSARNLEVRREIKKELRALKAIEDRSRRTSDPEVRRIVHEMINEASQRGMTVSDLYQGLSNRQGIMGRLGNIADNSNNLIYLGLLLLVLLSVPTFREAARPFLGKVVDEVESLGEKVKSMAVKAKEGVEDIIAEAQFERLQDALNFEAESDVTQDDIPENEV